MALGDMHSSQEVLLLIFLVCFQGQRLFKATINKNSKQNINLKGFADKVIR